MKKCEGVSGELSLYNNWSWSNVKVWGHKTGWSQTKRKTQHNIDNKNDEQQGPKYLLYELYEIYI
jgi:hypothetical protein